jgi:hypothetical protein
MTKYLLFLSLFLLFSGCVPKQPPKDDIDDLETISQNPSYYLSKIDTIELQGQNGLNKHYNERYFTPWSFTQLDTPKSEAMWGFGYQNRITYGQNYKKHTNTWYEDLKINSNFDNYNTYLKHAITVKNTNMRVLPTNQPIFLDPTQAGEGFPFDYNQNTTVYINTPLFISHLSQDKAWAYVATNFAMGWIATKDIALLGLQKRIFFQNNSYAVALKENFPIYDEKENFIEYIKLGTIFPIYKGKVIVAAKDRGLNGRLLYSSSPHIYKKPIPFNKSTLDIALNELLDEPYGWGGLYNARDCSSMTRDLFALFGIYLARNSAAQKYTGEYISLKEFSNKEKKEKILQLAKPFLTLLYLKGHVVLYVGEQNGEPIIFHQVWGVRTLDGEIPGRFIIGKTLFSTTEPGKELKDFDPQNSIITKIEGMIQLAN